MRVSVARVNWWMRETLRSQFNEFKRNSPMPLKLSLKPGEKFVLNGAVLSNGDKRTSLVIQNKACVLREKDIMQPEGAITPARRIYFPIMMMYLDPDEAERYYTDFAQRMTEFMGAV